MDNKPRKLIIHNESTNRLDIYLSDKTTDTEFDWRCYVSNYILNFLKSNKEGECYVILNTKRYKSILKDLLDYFDIAFPKRIHINWNQI